MNVPTDMIMPSVSGISSPLSKPPPEIISLTLPIRTAAIIPSVIITTPKTARRICHHLRRLKKLAFSPSLESPNADLSFFSLPKSDLPPDSLPKEDFFVFSLLKRGFLSESLPNEESAPKEELLPKKEPPNIFLSSDFFGADFTFFSFLPDPPQLDLSFLNIICLRYDRLTKRTVSRAFCYADAAEDGNLPLNGLLMCYCCATQPVVVVPSTVIEP